MSLKLYSHLTFQARWIVLLLTLIFGAGAFELAKVLASAQADHAVVRVR